MPLCRALKRTSPLPCSRVCKLQFSTSRPRAMPFIQVNYKRVYYKDWAPANGAEPKATLVMGHGLGSSNNYYTAVVPSLTNAGYRCIAYDLHGSALTNYTYIEQSIDTLASDVIDLMDVLSIPSAVYVGHSMSGITGPALAATWPARIAALVLVGPVHPSRDAAPMFEDRIAKVAAGGMEPLADTVPFAAVGSRAQRVHCAFIRELVLGMQPAAYISLCRVLAGAWRQPPRYEGVTCPVLIVAGEEDKSAPMAGCEAIYGKLGSGRKEMTVLQGVGHWHCVEAPEEVGTLVVDFLQSL